MAEDSKMKKRKMAHLMFIPIPGAGHLPSILEFANLLVNRFNNISITVFTSKFPFSPSPPSLTSSHPQIQLIPLPETPEPPSSQQLLLKARELYVLTFIASLIPHVKSAIQTILSSYSSHSDESKPLFALVLDFFCVSMVDVGIELGIPSYIYMTSNAGFLGYMFSILERQIDDFFSYSDPDLLIQGISIPAPSRVLPDASFNSDGGFVGYYKCAQRFRDTKGIIVNTFSELENYAIDALLSDGGRKRNPPIFAVGPLINLKGQQNPNLDQNLHEKIMKWLDLQPDCSVVFLCFGSRGSFGPSQTREIGMALRHTGVRFLWAMRSPPDKVIDEESALPEGFLEWMEGKGMICEWAPQVEVLAHKAIGGFVSHCGWNSILESLWFGVPILTWPIYAEQHLNAFRMVNEFGLAIQLTLDYRFGSNDVVTANEIENGLKQLMDRDNVVHKKVKEMKEMARKALLNGGSSFNSAGELIDNMLAYRSPS
ncbi:UDP-glycosyltransferase 71K1 isoform X1 [Arachis ipaensis]|uniref:UDP-glycosyltransferase 71K1 isoform X1 n=2 Tax=Arachis ipaensis TaxID=130454 RepID=UPI0007AF3135|nr:UDP-glycosyltransferase 71K1 isoform X1 [Arachis ipaensis]XP_025665724.1 UDP-glycosyltransferase 71K1 isoform X1 [Arachis hypogaea]